MLAMQLDRHFSRRHARAAKKDREVQQGRRDVSPSSRRADLACCPLCGNLLAGRFGLEASGGIRIRIGPIIPADGLSPDEMHERAERWIRDAMQDLRPEPIVRRSEWLVE